MIILQLTENRKLHARAPLGKNPDMALLGNSCALEISPRNLCTLEIEELVGKGDNLAQRPVAPCLDKTKSKITDGIRLRSITSTLTKF